MGAFHRTEALVWGSYIKTRYSYSTPGEHSGRLLFKAATAEFSVTRYIRCITPLALHCSVH